MKIGFIGAGKVGNSLARHFAEHQIQLSGFYSRSLKHAKQAADFTDSTAFFTLEELVTESDVIFITTPDGETGRVWEQVRALTQEGRLSLQGRFFAHCSGSLSSGVFQDIASFGAAGCSAHPMMAVSSKSSDMGSAFFTVEGQDAAVSRVKSLLMQCGNDVGTMKPECKTRYHTAASVASNLMVGLAQIAVELLESCEFSQEEAMKMLGGLMQGNMENICGRGPVRALTGPVERCDTATVESHLKALNGQEQEKEIYRMLSLKLIDIAKEKNPDRDYSGLKEKLEGQNA